MRVAIFTDNDFGKVNGVTTALQAAVDHAPCGLRLRIYTAAPIQIEEPHYLALASIGMPIPFYGEMRMYVPRVHAFLRHAAADQIDVVHLTTPGPVGLAAMWVAARLRLPMIGSFHTDLAAYTALLSGWPALGRLMREYMRWPYGRCKRVLVPSEATRQVVIDAKGDPGRLRIWSRGVDSKLFSPRKRCWQLREQWRVFDRRPALLYVGRISREKGLDLLPEVQERLQAMRVAHRFVIVGDGPMLSELRERMPDAVFTGALSRQQVAAVFASADLFVFPSRTDTAGNVVLEAQSSGLPVVVSNAGGPKEHMQPQRTGLLCASARPEEWAASIRTLLHDPAMHRGMAEAARQYALARRWDVTLEPLYRAYQEVAAEARAPLADTLAHARDGVS